jgi:hypothetical protein
LSKPEIRCAGTAGRCAADSGKPEQYRNDFETMRGIVDAFNAATPGSAQHLFLPSAFAVPGMPVEDEVLYKQQLELSAILESVAGYREAKDRLRASSLAHSEWNVEGWSDYMLETAVRIAGKWKEGWNDQ